MADYVLCVGINDYPGTGADLSGCVNDAKGWTDLFRNKNAEFQDRTIVTLLNTEATKANVITWLSNFVSKARRGDRIYFTYSGHGSWVPDQAFGDEPDGRDEVLCLYDFMSGGLLSDDELYNILQARRWGVRVYVFSDSCHSGSVNRFAGVVTPEKYFSARFIPPGVFLQDTTRAVRAENLPATGQSRPGSLLISGCSDLEYSYDAYIDGKAQGAFSWAALTTYRPNIAMTTWHKAILALLKQHPEYDQHPQLQASLWQRYWRL